MRGVWLVLATSACSFTPGVTLLDAAPGDADETLGWSTPVKIAALDDPFGADDPSLTTDLLELYFGTSRGGGQGMEDIWVAKRTSIDAAFGAPMPVTVLNSPLSETTMKVTGDGKAIYFASDRAGTGHDIYVSTRADVDSPWDVPVRVLELSTANGDWSPFAQSDQLRIVLCSGVNVAQEAMYTSTRPSTSDTWAMPVKVASLDVMDKSECDPMEPRANVLYYASDFLPADNKFHVYRASRATSSQPYSNRTQVSVIAMPGINDRDPWVSPDERTMVFSSDRDLVTYQIYITTRR